MKAAVVILRWLILLVAMLASPPVRAVWIEDEIPTNVITVTASSEYGPAADGAASGGRIGNAGWRPR